MNTSPTNSIFSTEGFAHRSDLATHAEEKAAKLRRHAHPHLGCVRVHVKRETPHSREPIFAVCVRAEAAGPDYVVHADGDEPLAAINEAFAKLERLVAAAARSRQQQQKHASLADLPAAE